MKYPTTVAATMLAAVVLAGAGMAQIQTEPFPTDRVDLIRPEHMYPQATYTENRVIMSQIEVNPAGFGYQISGRVITNFEVDMASDAGDAAIKDGTLLGIKVEIGLYSIPINLKRKTLDANQLPKEIITPIQKNEILVECEGKAQLTNVTLKEEASGYAEAEFKLPELARPLPPGAYRLIATVRFNAQDGNVRKAFKWVGDMYGGIMEFDEDLGEDVYLDVKDDPELHERTYKDLTDNVGAIKSSAVLYVANMLKKNDLDWGTSNAPTMLIWDHYVEQLGYVETLENQLSDLPDLIRDARNRAKDDALSEAARDKAKSDIEFYEKQEPKIKAEIEMWGGNTRPEERKLRPTAVAARKYILSKVYEWHQWLRRKYWELTDGVLLYGGYHQLNHPGYQAYDTIKSQDMEKSKKAREEKLDAAKAAPGGLRAMKEKRDDQWKYQPIAIRREAFDYLDDKLEKATYDGDKFATKEGGKVVFDVDAWAKYRSDFTEKFLTKTDKLLEEVNTSINYAVTIWPSVYNAAVTARDAVIQVGFAWEFYNRCGAGPENMREEREDVRTEWKENEPEHLQQIIATAAVSPGAVKSRFDGSISQIKSTISMSEVTVAYRRAVDAGSVLPGDKRPD